MEQISLPVIRVDARLDGSQVVVQPIGVVVKPETIAGESDTTPLNMLVAGLASCEALMFAMIADKMGVKLAGLEVSVSAEFRIGYGMTKASIEYRVSGVDASVAERIAGMVKEYCPVYRTFERAGVELEDKITIV